MQITEVVLEGCRRHERAAQAELYRLCYPTLMRVALRYAPNADDAADILNRGLFKVFTKIEQFAGAAQNFGGWIRRIIMGNEALDFIKANPAFKKHEALEAATEELANYPPLQTEEAAGKYPALTETIPMMTATVSTLPICLRWKGIPIRRSARNSALRKPIQNGACIRPVNNFKVYFVKLLVLKKETPAPEQHPVDAYFREQETGIPVAFDPGSLGCPSDDAGSGGFQFRPTAAGGRMLRSGAKRGKACS